MSAVRQGSQTFVIIAGLQLAAVLAWAQTATSLPQDQLNPTGAPTSNVLQLPQSSVFPQPASTNKATPISLTLADAIARARANNPAFQAALVRFGLARQDSMIARSTLLPGVDFNNTYLYTQGNGTLSGRFVANNGVHEYLDQGVVQQSMGLGLVADYRRARAAEALTRAQAEVAARGLVVTVVQAYYGLQAAEAKATSTQAAADEAQNFLKLSRELEQGGEVAHSDVIKAEIQANDQQRVLQDTKLAAANARLTLAVLLFPNFFQDFTLADNLSASTPLPPMSEVQAKAQKNNPELAAAFSSLEVS